MYLIFRLNHDLPVFVDATTQASQLTVSDLQGHKSPIQNVVAIDVGQGESRLR